MRRKKQRRRAALAVTAATTLISSAAAWAEAAPAAAEAYTGSGPAAQGTTDKIPGFHLTFEGVMVNLSNPPVLVGDTMMVPARALLEGLGYRLEWDDAEAALTASRPAGPTLKYWVGRQEAVREGSTVYTLPEGPYLDEGLLWIPLRPAAEMSGLEVLWNAADRSVTVRDPDARIAFSVGTRADSGGYGTPERLLDYMKREMRTDIRFTLIPPDHYREKVNLMIAAGDPTDLMLIARPYDYDDELFRSIASDLTDLLEDFPRLRALAESESHSVRTIDGRVYGIPRPFDSQNAAFPVIRQDWLDRLGLATPRTMDQLYEVLWKFAKTDPDGDGKDNTVGLTGRLTVNGLGSFTWVEQVYTGSPARFAVKNGEVLDAAAEAGERRALGWLARAYENGVLDPEAPIVKDEHVTERLLQNRAGAAALTLDQAAALMADSDLTDKWAPIWVPLPSLGTETTEPVAPWNAEGSGTYIIPRTVPHDKAMKILEWLDQGLAMQQSGEWERVPGMEEADRSAVANLFGSTDLLQSFGSPVQQLPDAVRQRYEETVADWRQASYERKTLPKADRVLRNKEYIQMNEELEKLKVHVIIGKATLEDWDRHIEEMKKSDTYRRMMAELQALLSE